MTRRVFISYQHEDRKKANGFRILRWNKNVDVEFQDRHLLSPVDSTNEDYIKRSIRREMRGTSTTVVIVGKETDNSKWVDYEIQHAIDEGKGIVAIKAHDDVTDVDVPDKIRENGGEVLDWNPDEFADAIERAAQQRVKVGQSTVHGTRGSGCGR